MNQLERNNHPDCTISILSLAASQMHCMSTFFVLFCKLVILRYSMMNAFSEGITLAERSGLNPATLLDVLVIHFNHSDSCSHLF